MTTERNPFTAVLTKHLNVTSGTSMITRAPYPNGQYYKIRKIECATLDTSVSGGVLWKFWDQDLSSTTAATVGSASSALIYVTPGAFASGSSFGVASGFGGITVNKTSDQLPQMPFYAGITVHTTLSSNINLELEIA